MADNKVVNLAALRALSALVSRQHLASLAGKTFESERDLYKWLGYKRTLEYEDFQSRYERGGIASRIVDAFPQATWRTPPELKVGDTTFEEFNALAERLQLYHIFERVDKLAGIGRYAGLLIGVKGGSQLQFPVGRLRTPEQIIYVTPLSEANCEIESFVENPADPRFGLPEFYNVHLSRRHDGQAMGGKVTPTPTKVHYSRILHVAEGLLEDQIFGRPRLQTPWNYLDDLDKMVGGTAEAVWRTVDRGLQFNLDPDTVLDPSDEDDFSEAIEDYVHNLKRYIRTQGVEINNLGSDPPDTSRQINAQIALISGTTGIPQRILMGSEAGQMASTQDERNFNTRVAERQRSYAQVTILGAFISRLVEFGALTIPGGGYTVHWPDLGTLTDREKSDVAARVGQAISHVARQPPENIVMTGEEFRKKYLNWEV